MIALASASGALIPQPSFSVQSTIQMRAKPAAMQMRPEPLEHVAREERLLRTAAHYGLDPEIDALEIATLAASSLPEEENGTWRDVAVCSLRNFCVLALLLGAIGAIPGQASATDAALAAASSTVALSEEADVIASILVPLGVGIIAVGFLAANFEKLIDKLND